MKKVDHVDWICLYQPIMKIDPYIYKLAPDEKGKVKIRINFFKNEAVQPVIALLEQTGYKDIKRIDGMYRPKIVVSILETELEETLRAVAFNRSVEWIQAYPDYDLCNDYTQWVCQSGPYSGGATPLYDNGIFGAGQIVGVMDTGADADKCYFYDSDEGIVIPGDPANYD
jgi:hypothetical protein